MSSIPVDMPPFWTLILELELGFCPTILRVEYVVVAITEKLRHCFCQLSMEKLSY